MRLKNPLTAVLIIGLSLVCCQRSFAQAPKEQETEAGKYIALAWNDLGMHCYSSDYQDLAILPPFNNLFVQVIKVQEPPLIVTEGIEVAYLFEDNTYSAGKTGSPDKTNFWTYAKKLFGVDLAANTGLAGKSLSGTMDREGDHFVARGIPLTEYRDQDASENDRSTWSRHPFQLATIIVKDKATHQELFRTTAVAPVSNELNCAKCHGDDGMATQKNNITPSGRPAMNILALHDKFNRGKYKPPLTERRPVLCAGCHSSNALGKKGLPGIPSLSNAVHNRHKNLKAITPDTAGCYSCHPGNRTQCLRDVMSSEFNLNCTTCHGTMAKVARNPQPWLNEPRCDRSDCHGSGYKLDQPLYKNSRGTGKVYCAGCHDSPHAIAPSREEVDSRKFVELQGEKRTLYKCEVCHGTRPKDPFNHQRKAE